MRGVKRDARSWNLVSTGRNISTVVTFGPIRTPRYLAESASLISGQTDLISAKTDDDGTIVESKTDLSVLTPRPEKCAKRSIARMIESRGRWVGEASARSSAKAKGVWLGIESRYVRRTS
jgi:hypothetical protein